MSNSPEIIAATQIEKHFRSALDRYFPAPLLENYIDLFPENLRENHPSLLLIKGIVYLMRFDLTALAAIIAAFDEQTVQMTPEQQASYKQLAGSYYYWTVDLEKALPLLKEAYEQMPINYRFEKATCCMFYSFTLYALGERCTAYHVLTNELIDAEKFNLPTQLIFLCALAACHYYAGELAQTTHYIKALETLANYPLWRDIGFAQIWYSWAHYLTAQVAYQQNDLDTAKRNFTWVSERCSTSNYLCYLDSLIGLAATASIENNIQEMTLRLGEAEYFVNSVGSYFLKNHFRSALMWAGLTDLDLSIISIHATGFWLEFPPATVAYLLITQNRSAEALPIIDQAIKYAEEIPNTAQLITLYSLRALISTLKDPFSYLDHAVSLAEKGGYIRPFLDLGEPMFILLQKHSQKKPSLFVARVLAAFVKEQGRYTKPSMVLTRRELQLLALLDQGSSIRQISTELVLSPNTVKKHLSNIYEKLGVRNSRQALIMARELELIR